MASIRIPESASPILKFCAPSKDKSSYFFFPTYGHVVLFAACFGYSLDQFDEEVKTFSHDPDPISIEIFKNQDLYDPILVLGLSKTGAYDIAEDEDNLARIVEGYASAGFRHLVKILDEQTEHNFMDYLISQQLENKKNNKGD